MVYISLLVYFKMISNEIPNNLIVSYPQILFGHVAVSCYRQHEGGQILCSMTKYLELHASLYHQSGNQGLVAHARVRTDQQSNSLIQQGYNVQFCRG